MKVDLFNEHYKIIGKVDLSSEALEILKDRGFVKIALRTDFKAVKGTNLESQTVIPIVEYEPVYYYGNFVGVKETKRKTK